MKRTREEREGEMREGRRKKEEGGEKREMERRERKEGRGSTGSQIERNG